jgi:hypothetical protein
MLCHFPAMISHRRRTLLRLLLCATTLAVAATWLSAGPNPAGVNPSQFTDAELSLAAKVRPIDSNTLAVGLVTLNKSERTLTLPAKINMLEHNIEYALVTTTGKRHESLLTTEAQPRDLHVAALLLGIEPSAHLEGTNAQLAVPPQAAVTVDVTWPTPDGLRRQPLHRLIGLITNSEKDIVGTLAATSWLYNGSELVERRFLAQAEGSIISLITDPVALINNPLPSRGNDRLHVPNKPVLPPVGTAVQVVLRLANPLPPAAPAVVGSPTNLPAR